MSDKVPFRVIIQCCQYSRATEGEKIVHFASFKITCKLVRGLHQHIEDEVFKVRGRKEWTRRIISKELEPREELFDPASTVLVLLFWVNLSVTGVFQAKPIDKLHAMHAMDLEVVPDVLIANVNFRWWPSGGLAVAPLRTAWMEVDMARENISSWSQW
jgi:hypothetical protein